MPRPSRSLVAGFLAVVLLVPLCAAPVAASRPDAEPGLPRSAEDGLALASQADPPSGTAEGVHRPHAAALPPLPAATNTTNIDPDAVVMEIDVARNGSALWRVSYRLRLGDENETTAFESLQGDIARNETAYTDRFADRINRTVSFAENATGRSMSVGPVDISTRREAIPQEYGVVTYEFRWDGFAHRAGDRLLVGDAVSGLFLNRRTTLRLRWPAGYRLQRVDPAPDDRQADTAVWRGPTEFADARPRLTLRPATPRPAVDAAPETGTDPTQGTSGEPSWITGSVLLVLLLAVLAGYAYHSRRQPDGGAGPADGPPNTGGESAEAGAGTPPELLSNEERVLQLLEANGGRMKQQAVAEELEWTDAKTSQVVGDLREAEAVETFRLGRENVVTLPDAGGPIE